MQALLYVDLGKKTCHETLGGQAYVWPILVQGDSIRLSVRLFSRIDGAAMEVPKNVTSMVASIGRVDQRPTSGGFRLRLGDAPPVVGVNVTKLMPHDVRANVLRAELESLSITSGLGEVAVTERDGSWQIVFAGLLNPIAIELKENSLIPLSFARTRHFEFNGEWIHEFRLVQAPVAFTSSHVRAVPPGPSLTVVQHGGTDASAQWNEVQRLFLPPQFRGTYQIKRGFSRSAIFSIEDGIDEISQGLQSLADDGGEFVVTSPQTGVAMIEFAGSMAGHNYDALTVEVLDAPIGDLTVKLDLDTAELAAMLRTVDEVKLPLEVEAIIQDDQDAFITYRTTIIRQEVTIRRELNWDGLSSPQNIDWIRPPLPRNYIPWREDQVYFGEFHWSDSFGDGEVQEFTFDHNLQSILLHVTVAENGGNGRVLVNGVDYELQLEDENSLKLLHLGNDPPSPGGLIIIISAAGTRGAFQAHTHTVAQIVGLQTILENFGTRIETLETLVPTGALTVEAAAKEKPIAEWTLPPFREVYPTRSKIEMKLALAEMDLSGVRASGLLPAIHVNATEELPSPIPPNPSEGQLGKVYENTSINEVTLDGGLGRRSVQLKTGEFAAVLEHGGRVSWYRVAKLNNSESSWYPTDFERELFMLSINEKQLRLGTKLEVNFGLEAAIFKSNTKAMWTLLIEWGAYINETLPAITGANLKKIEWASIPILEQVIDLTSVPCTHEFGCVIAHVMDGGIATLKASRIIYGASETTGSVPTSARFALRARLVRFDTEDNQPDPRGLVALLGLDRSVVSNSDKSGNIGKASIYQI